MSGSGEKAIFFSPRRLTPTERRILLYVARHNGKACSKGEIAQQLGRNKKTVDRLVARPRADGLLESEPVPMESLSPCFDILKMINIRNFQILFCSFLNYIFIFFP